jgi:hypothetical protein
MNTTTKLAAFGICSAMFACTGQVIDQSDNAFGTNQGLNPGQGQGGSAAGGSASKPTQLAVAMTRAQGEALWQQDISENSSGYTVTTTGGGLDPNDLFIRISDQGASCQSAHVELDCGGHFYLSVALPPAYQAVGVYDLEDPAIASYSMMSETGAPYDSPDDCSWGGGTVGSGTIEVTGITDTALDVVIQIKDSFWDNNPSGKYTVPRCQP